MENLPLFFQPLFSFATIRSLNTGWPWPLASSFRGHGFELWPGKIPHGMGQLRSCATTTEARMPKVQAPKQEESLQREAQVPPPEGSPRLSHLEKAAGSSEDPAQSIIKA